MPVSSTLPVESATFTVTVDVGSFTLPFTSGVASLVKPTSSTSTTGACVSTMNAFAAGALWLPAASLEIA